MQTFVGAITAGVWTDFKIILEEIFGEYSLTHFFPDDKSVGVNLKKKIVSELRNNRDKCAAEKGEAFLAKRHTEGTWYLSII